MLPSNYEQLIGWCPKEKAEKLLELASSEKVSLCVELGVYGGRSLLPLALALSQRAGTRVVGVDAWSVPAAMEGTNSKENEAYWTNVDYSGMFEYTKKLVSDHQVAHLVDLWRCKSVDVYDRFEDNSIDLLHQDSNHSEEVSCREVELYCAKVRPGGYWVFDDTHWPTTQTAQQKLLAKGFVEIFSEKDNSWKVFQKLD